MPLLVQNRLDPSRASEISLYRNGEFSLDWKLYTAETRAATRSGAPRASYDKWSRRPWLHRNCCHNKFSQEIDHFTYIFKKVNISLGQRSVGAITRLHRLQKKYSRRSEFTPELRMWVLKLTTSHLLILQQEIVCRFYMNFSKSFDHHGKPKKEMVKNSFE